MKKLIAFFSGNSLFVNLLAIGVLIAGIIYLQTENREAFPKIDFDFVIVSTIYPGATPSDVEKHVTIEIEEQLREVDGIEELSSNSLESRSVVVVQLDPDLENKDKTVNDIKNAIDRIKDFPEDVEDPEVTELNTDQQPVLDISIINKNGIHNDADEFKMRKYASILEDRLITTTGVARIEKKGYRDHEMIVE
ncbi:MAG TPA: efflux RND transporter permease subunit, partial [Spirochaetota bacterium]|nr:efflux RND transporter permease subunit [Spirochaetota bacterium]